MNLDCYFAYYLKYLEQIITNVTLSEALKNEVFNIYDYMKNYDESCIRKIYTTFIKRSSSIYNLEKLTAKSLVSLVYDWLSNDINRVLTLLPFPSLDNSQKGNRISEYYSILEKRLLFYGDSLPENYRDNIESIKPLGDYHHQQRHVFSVESKEDKYVFYPRSSIHCYILELICECCEFTYVKVIKPLINCKTEKVFFTKYIYEEPIKDEPTLIKAFGQLLAIAIQFKLTDIHEDNILFTSGSIILADCETLFSPQVNEDYDKDNVLLEVLRNMQIIGKDICIGRTIASNIINSKQDILIKIIEECCASTNIIAHNTNKINAVLSSVGKKKLMTRVIPKSSENYRMHINLFELSPLFSSDIRKSFRIYLNNNFSIYEIEQMKNSQIPYFTQRIIPEYHCTLLGERLKFKLIHSLLCGQSN